MLTVTFENVCRAHMKRQVIIKMNKFNIFITAVYHCVLFLISLARDISRFGRTDNLFYQAGQFWYMVN